jgi:hypothetical protein
LGSTIDFRLSPSGYCLVATEASEDGLTSQACHRVLTVPGNARITTVDKPRNIVEFAEGEQTSIRRDTGAVELQLQAAVEIQRARSRIHQPGSPSAPRNLFTESILTAESAPIRINDWSYKRMRAKLF